MKSTQSLLTSLGVLTGLLLFPQVGNGGRFGGGGARAGGGGGFRGAAPMSRPAPMSRSAPSIPAGGFNGGAVHGPYGGAMSSGRQFGGGAGPVGVAGQHGG